MKAHSEKLGLVLQGGQTLLTLASGHMHIGHDLLQKMIGSVRMTIRDELQPSSRMQKDEVGLIGFCNLHTTKSACVICVLTA